MRSLIEDKINKLLAIYRQDKHLPELWRTPIIKFVDAAHPEIPKLRNIVYGTHYMPSDFLDNPTVILSCFFPFSEEAVNSNIEQRYASKLWIWAYTYSEDAARFISASMTDEILKWGSRAALPKNTGYAGEGIYKSRWSHRHIARLGGMGTFGMNNLLITDSGCCGYYSSIITDLPIKPDHMLQEERCLYKIDGSCGLCIKRCVGDALGADGFNRNKCYDMCMENAKHYAGADFISEADACGKCAAGMPCSLRNPLTKR